MSVMVAVVLLMVISNNIQKSFVDGVDAMSEIFNIQTINLKKWMKSEILVYYDPEKGEWSVSQLQVIYENNQVS